MTNTKTRSAHTRAKQILKSKGYSYRSGAPVLGVNFSHLSRVLNGHRTSQSLLKRIEAMPRKGGAE